MLLGRRQIRSAYFTPAVEFIQANLFRTYVMQQMDKPMADLDLLIGSNQLLTNRTGHPVVSMPQRIPPRFANCSALHRQDLR